MALAPKTASKPAPAPAPEEARPRRRRPSAGQRLVLAAVLGAAAGGLASRHAALNESVLIGWCSFAVCALAMAAISLGPAGAGPTTESLERNDQSLTAILLVVLLGCGMSVLAIGALLLESRGLPIAKRWPHGLLSLATIVLTWLLIQVRFAFHYAHRNLQARIGASGRKAHLALQFPSTETPSYHDYLYFSCVIGMTSQVSDVTVHSPAMRRLVLWHSLLSFGFNLLILALAVNALASLVQ